MAVASRLGGVPRLGEVRGEATARSTARCCRWSPTLNRIRRDHPALQHLADISFLDTENEALIAYVQVARRRHRAVRGEPRCRCTAQDGVAVVPAELGLPPVFEVIDLLTGERFTWHTGRNYVRLDPGRAAGPRLPCHAPADLAVPARSETVDAARLERRGSPRSGGSRRRDRAAATSAWSTTRRRCRDEPPLTAGCWSRLRLATDTGPRRAGAVPAARRRPTSDEGARPTRSTIADGTRRGSAELLLAGGAGARWTGRSVEFHWVADEPHRPDRSRARPLGAEQSNSSLLIDDQVVLKLFRRLEAGVNPELEMLRFLHSHGFTQVPELSGGSTCTATRSSATLAVARGFRGRRARRVGAHARRARARRRRRRRPARSSAGSSARCTACWAATHTIRRSRPSSRAPSGWPCSRSRWIGTSRTLFAALPSTPELEPLAGRGERGPRRARLAVPRRRATDGSSAPTATSTSARSCGRRTAG